MTMTNEALRAAILSGIDTITALPGFRMFSSLEQRNILAGQRMYWQQANEASLTILAGMVPATTREESEPMAAHKLTAAQVDAFKAAIPPATLAKLEADAKAAGFALNWAAIIPAIMATANEWPTLVAEGGKLVAIWAPVFAAAGPPTSSK